MKHKPLYDVRKISDLKDMLEQSADLYSSKDAFLVKYAADPYKSIKYREFKQDVDALGTVLLSLGLKDKFIAVIGENRYEWCVTYLAAVNGTGIVVPLDKELPPSEIENLLVRSDACAVVFAGKYAGEMQKLKAAVPSVQYFINMDAGQDNTFFLSFSGLLEKGRQLISSGNCAFLAAKIDPEKMCSLIFTSGTTELAKGVMLSHKNICSDIMSVCTMIYVDHHDSVLSILPLHHTYECTCGFLLMLYNGCTISFAEGLKHIAKNLRETRPTILLLVPLILESMYRKIWEQAGKKKTVKLVLKAAIFVSNILLHTLHIDLRKKLFRKILENVGGKIRLIISGAAAIDPKVSAGFRSIGIHVVQGYGLTECSPIVTVNRECEYKDASIGLPLTGTEVKLENPGHDGMGEIVVRGDHVMSGYFKNEEATRKVLRDGWFYTGDLGFMDSEGFFYITGREKNVIVTKNGKNIYPEEVEAYLNRSPYILESIVWGKYDGATGETLVNAQIVPDFEAIRSRLKLEMDARDEIFRLIRGEVKSVNRNMPLYKRIRAFTLHENEFAKTTTKKIKRYMEKVKPVCKQGGQA